MTGDSGNMATKKILYFDRPGPDNTESVAAAVALRVKEPGIRYVVAASNTGKTALIFHEALKGLDVTLIAVTEHAGFSGGDKVYMSGEQRAELEAKGIRTLMCSHALSGIERSFTKKFGGVSRVEIVAHTLRELKNRRENG